MLIPKDPAALGIIMEFKKAGRLEKMSLKSAVASALKQIKTKRYSQELLEQRGVKDHLYLGLAFQGKEVLIRSKFNKAKKNGRSSVPNLKKSAKKSRQKNKKTRDLAGKNGQKIGGRKIFLQKPIV